jgi:hypothetical protein
MLALGLTAAGTAGLRLLRARVCRGHDEGSDAEGLGLDDLEAADEDIDEAAFEDGALEDEAGEVDATDELEEQDQSGERTLETRIEGEDDDEDDEASYESVLEKGVNYEGSDPAGLEKDLAYEGPDEDCPHERPL